MGTIAAAVRELIALGVQGDALVGAIERMEAAQAAAWEQPEETREERKRRISRETSARHRVSRNVTNVSPRVTDAGDADRVTSRHPVTFGDTNASPLARVEDNPLRLVDTCRTDADEDASAWDRDRINRVERDLREAAGEAIDPTAASLLNPSPIIRLLRGGEGPRCDLELDVLPSIRAVAAKAKRGSVRNWSYFRHAITQSRDERLAGAPVVVVDFPTRAQGPPGGYRATEAHEAAVREQVNRKILESP